MTESIKQTERALRFGFGANWGRFLSVLSERRIEMAQQSLKAMLAVEDLNDKTFLDVGCGSGLFSLVARRLGARVYSFDYDPKSVACADELKRRFCPFDSEWTVANGSILDNEYLRSLGTFDVVYSWGVLHHTGAMWNAMENIQSLVVSEGKLALAIYNDQGWTSKYWTWMKKSYNSSALSAIFVTCFHLPYLLGLRWIVRRLTRRHYIERGMSLWYDMVDWLGGYPFEVAKPEEIYTFYKDKDFVLTHLKTCGGRHGCNEFVFLKSSSGK